MESFVPEKNRDMSVSEGPFSHLRIARSLTSSQMDAISVLFAACCCIDIVRDVR